MIPDPPRHAKTPTPSERLDALEAQIDDAERRIDDVLAPEPVDWEAVYRERFAAVVEAAGRMAGGA